jgi:peptide-methionine (S)-S-oxide reductase
MDIRPSILRIAITMSLSAANGAAASQGGPASMDKTRETESPPTRSEVATLGGGCFWCLEAVFAELRGVSGVESGFSGGSAHDATYERVCGGRTGHAEVVQVTFDPSIVSFGDLLEVFFTIHDPTTLDRQGADAGTQYRSVVFYDSPSQKATANEVIAHLTVAKVWDDPIVTQVAPFQAFYKAEDYHQQYFERNGNAPYCRIVIAPKVAKFREKFLDQLRK